MKTMIRLISLSVLFLIVGAVTATAQTATLAWDPSVQPEVVGYNLYYRTDTATFPFNGTSLPEGASPIYVAGGDAGSLTVDLPDDGKIYYFTATAVSDTGLESAPSEIIASEWIPNLLAPADRQSVPLVATFSWGQAPLGYNVTYELHYGTDPNLNQSAAVVPTAKAGSNGSPFSFLLAIPAALLLALLTTRRFGFGRRLRVPVRIGICLGLFVLQAACGGGGSGDYGSTGVTVSNDPVPTAQAVTVVADITGTDYQVANLAPATTYYWKIVAVDATGYQYESVTKSFTTASN